MNTKICEYRVLIPVGSVELEGDLTIPAAAQGIVLFAHGSGSSRHSPRNRYVAEVLQQEGLATLLLDLLTADEEEIDLRTRHLRFDISLLSERLVSATDWLCRSPVTRQLNIGYFGASTGSAAALLAATKRPDVVKAIVSRGGRPDLIGPDLNQVQAAILLIVGGNDFPVIAMNEDAFSLLGHTLAKRLEIIPKATHLFGEVGALEQVAALASEWFKQYLMG